MRRAITLVLALALLGSVACAKKDDGQAAERPRSTATLTIVSPKPNDVVDGKTFPVKIDLQGGRIVKVVEQDLTPDEGHMHVSIDGKLVTQTFSLNDKLPTPKKKGSHLLQAEFVAKDHGPFDPRVLTSAPFEVG